MNETVICIIFILGCVSGIVSTLCYFNLKEKYHPKDAYKFFTNKK